ncbi:hypothetical protein [Novosphingobium lindaniclasticum]|uniref:Uncharacterized protein n=1 Tax=Novosphingobium lindaniclasticum LE124 TaxID=1096930 RepID=T0HE70_9SPHN|nr:hypothetical protein [Novosphingobium lindaniclasticum]EQB10393.1 hypothetical protein L284_17005 [Novosphingobium lindaniclasticum LE124]
MTLTTTKLAKIDVTKPLQLADGTPVAFARRSHMSMDGYEVIIKPNTTGREVGQHRHFRADGIHVHSTLPNLQNVLEATLDTSKPLQTSDGKPVTFVGKLEDGRLVVQVGYGSAFSRTQATELRFADGRKSAAVGVTSGDDVIVKVTKTEKFRNVYADGTLGTTAHKTEEAARQNVKFGKVRIGILKQVFEDGTLVDARMVPLTPTYRNRGVTVRNATREDFAR